jgi:stress-induced morphogen
LGLEFEFCGVVDIGVNNRLTYCVPLQVQDISGGCGSMYALEIVSPKFKGLSMIKQHKLVNSILTDEIKGWHGVRLNTKAPV